MNILSLVPRWAYGALLGVVLLAGGGWWCYSAGKAHTQRLWDADKQRAENAGLKADAAQRVIETADATSKEENHGIVEADLAKAKVDAARAYAAYQRLQHEYADYLRAGAARASASATAGEPAARTPDLLSAELLSRLGARATELAGYADAARTSGASCEREYDAVRANRAVP